MNFGTDRVLVTGATGWLGTGLVNALVNGLADCQALHVPQSDLRIRALILPGEDPTTLRAMSERIEVVVGDIRNPKDCAHLCEEANGAVLFHTAGVIHPRRVSEFKAINTEGTENLLKAAIAARVRRAIVVSSNSPCGCNPHSDHRFDEGSRYNPYMHYGRSKMQMECVVKDIQEAGQIETVIIRAPWFYGPFQPPRQTLFFAMIRDGKAPVVGGGEQLRSMTYIDNLCQGLLLAATVEQGKGQLYWIADERPYSMNEVIDTVERLLETEFHQTCAHKRLRLPGVVSGIAWMTDWTLQSLGLYHQKIHVLSEMNKNIACSVDKAKRELGYEPGVSLEEGMRRSLQWLARGGELKF